MTQQFLDLLYQVIGLFFTIVNAVIASYLFIILFMGGITVFVLIFKYIGSRLEKARL